MGVRINSNDLLLTLTGLSITTLSVARFLEMEGIIPIGSTAKEIRRRVDLLPKSLAGTSTETIMDICASWLEADEETGGKSPTPFPFH